MQLQKITEENLEQSLLFLEKYEDSCMFLLNNRLQYGLDLQEHSNSGDYMAIEQNNQIQAVFCLTKRGNLLLQTNNQNDYSQIILKSCLDNIKKYKINFGGIIGDHKSSMLFFQLLKNKNLITEELRTGSEKLYSLSLIDYHDFNEHSSAKVLQESDFEEYNKLTQIYLEELSLENSNNNQDTAKKDFINAISRQATWGLEINEKLVSLGEFNARYKHLAQIGGVFTLPEARRKGYSKVVMQRLIFDAKYKLNVTKLVLFTGHYQVPAWTLYESLGFKYLGDFAMTFFQTSCL